VQKQKAVLVQCILKHEFAMIALASLHIHRFSHFVLIGDFNINMNNPDDPLYSKVCNIMEVFGLTQVVTKCVLILHKVATALSLTLLWYHHPLSQ